MERTDDLLKPAEVAHRLGVSRSWLYEAASSGRIPCVRLGGDDGPVRFVEADLAAWLECARRGWVPGESATNSLERAASEQANGADRTTRAAWRKPARASGQLSWSLGDYESASAEA